MKQLSLAICLCFALAPAMAADAPTATSSRSSTDPAAVATTPTPPVPVPSAPAASDVAATTQPQPIAPVEAPVIHIPPAPAVVECAPAAPPAPPPAPVETAASKLRAAQQNLALPKVELLRTTIKNTTPSKNLFARFLSSSSKPIDVDLLVDIRRFTERFPDFPETAEAFHLMAVVHQRTDNNPAAAIDWLMLRAAYPDSPFSKEAVKQLQALAAGDLKKHADTLKTMGAQIDKLTGERDERMAAMLLYLGGNTEKDFAAPIADACASFLVSNQSWIQEDVIEHALARQTMLLDPQVALYRLNKILALYPSSPLRPDSMLSIGNVQHNNLNAFDQAAKSYSKLIEQYPDSAEAKQGYELLGATYDVDLQDYPNALKTYEAVVAKYKDDPVVLRALRAMANIQQSKTRQPANAIASYLKIADIFKGADGLQALLAAENLALSATEDWVSAIDINHRIMALAPQDEEAVKAQFNNADITENKLNNKEVARTMYVAFASKYPNHALAKDANRRIESLNKALSKP